MIIPPPPSPPPPQNMLEGNKPKKCCGKFYLNCNCHPLLISLRTDLYGMLKEGLDIILLL